MHRQCRAEGGVDIAHREGAVFEEKQTAKVENQAEHQPDPPGAPCSAADHAGQQPVHRDGHGQQQQMTRIPPGAYGVEHQAAEEQHRVAPACRHQGINGKKDRQKQKNKR